MKQRILEFVYEEERDLFIYNNKKIYNKKENEENDYRNIAIKEDDKNNEQDAVGVFDSWWKYFITYFLASVGDKSQIATILITSKYNFVPLFNGTTVGILVLVFIAMLFGKTLSGLLTNRQVSIISGVFFLLYALIFFVDKKLAKFLHVNTN